MSEEQAEDSDSIESLRREKARLRKAAVIILIVGLCSAGLLYWIRNRPADPALAQFRQDQARLETRQMETLYGTSGDVMQKVLDGLKRPRNQALIIVGLTLLISGACFYLGRPFPADDTYVPNRN